MIWTDEAVADLQRRWEAGESSGTIADALNISRSSVMGKIHREGFSSPAAEERRQKVAAAARKKQERANSHRTESIRKARIAAIKRKAGVTDRLAKPDAPMPTEAPEPLHYTLMERPDRACKYPFGSKPYTFCGHARRTGSSYCPYHHGVVWTPVRERVR